MIVNSLEFSLLAAVLFPRSALIIVVCLGIAVLFVAAVAAFLIWRDRQS